MNLWPSPWPTPPELESLYDDKFFVNAKELADALHVPLADLAEAFGVYEDELAAAPRVGAIQSKARYLIAILSELTHYFSNEWSSTISWIHAPRVELEGRTPFQFVREGDLDSLAGMVRSIGMGEPT